MSGWRFDHIGQDLATVANELDAMLRDAVIGQSTRGLSV
jgi:hypothetical protein